VTLRTLESYAAVFETGRTAGVKNLAAVSSPVLGTIRLQLNDDDTAGVYEPKKVLVLPSITRPLLTVKYTLDEPTQAPDGCCGGLAPWKARRYWLTTIPDDAVSWPAEAFF